jgi:hypothetical protein
MVHGRKTAGLPSMRGSIFLLSVLVGGTIALATAVSLLLLSGAAEKTAFTFQESLQALEGARTCAERGILNLRGDLTYAGDENLDLGYARCIIHPVGGTGNASRTLCVEGVKDGIVRRLQISILKLYSQVSISSWDEVSSFTLCP